MTAKTSKKYIYCNLNRVPTLLHTLRMCGLSGKIVNLIFHWYCSKHDSYKVLQQGTVTKTVTELDKKVDCEFSEVKAN